MHVSCSDTLDSLHAVGEQRQDDDTTANSADLATGHQCKLHLHWLFRTFGTAHCEAHHLIPSVFRHALLSNSMSDKQVNTTGKPGTSGQGEFACKFWIVL